MLGALGGAGPLGGAALAASAMAVMFALFALKTVGALLLDERTWRTGAPAGQPGAVRRDPGWQGAADVLRGRRPAGDLVRIRRNRLRPHTDAGMAPLALVVVAWSVHPDARNRGGDARA
jgi:hypothetical protein